MHFEIHCPYCSGLVQVRSENVGNLLQCPACPGKFRVPADMLSSQTSPSDSFGAAGSGSLNASGQLSGSAQFKQAGRQPVQRASANMPAGQRGGQRTSHQPQHMMQPAAASVPMYASYSRPNQRQDQNQNMVFMVGGVVVGVILVLFVAMLVVLGSGQMNGNNMPSSTTVATQEWEPETEKENVAAEQTAEVQRENKIHQNADGTFGFNWDPSDSIERVRRSSNAAQVDEDGVDQTEGFRGRPEDFGVYKPREHKPVIANQAVSD